MREGKYIIHFHSKETKIKTDFTRTTKEDKIHFSRVNMRRKITKKGRKSVKRRMERITNISEITKREGSNRNNENELRNPSLFLLRRYSDRIISSTKDKSHKESTCEP